MGISLWGGPGRTAPLLGTTKDMFLKPLEWASASIGATLLRNKEGCPGLRAFEVKRYIKRYVKMYQWERIHLHRGHAGETSEDLLVGTFWEKRKIYLSSFLDPENLNPYPTAFPYGNGMVLHFYQQQESSTNKTVHKVINKGLKTYV